MSAGTAGVRRRGVAWIAGACLVLVLAGIVFSEDLIRLASDGLPPDADPGSSASSFTTGFFSSSSSSSSSPSSSPPGALYPADPPPLDPVARARCAHDPRHEPRMTPEERSLMLKYVSGDFPGATWGDGAAVYLEWGGGGSTSVFGTRAARTHTVEHHPEWCAAIREWDEIKCLRDAGAWRLFCHDVAERTGAPLAKWGRPAAGLDPGVFADAMRPYVQAPGRFGAEHVAYDVVLIDGRMRNACAHAIVPYLHADSVVGWHDFSDEDWDDVPKHPDATLDVIDREQGHNVDRMYAKGAGRLFDKVERRGRLAIFKLKPAIAKQTGWVE